MHATILFNVRDGTDYTDEEGLELPDLTAARVEAVKCSGDFIREHAVEFWSGHEWQMNVTDDRRLILFTLTFFASDAPSIGAAPRA